MKKEHKIKKAVVLVFLIVSAITCSAFAVDTQTWTDPVTGMEFVSIPAGCFQMGCSASDTSCYDSEKPQHDVCLEAFWIGKYEVTQAQWKKVMEDNPSMPEDDDAPVNTVSFEMIQEFLQKLNQQAGKEIYRLPTEAEWEYAARAGTDTAYSFGDDVAQLVEYGWYSANSDYKQHPVGELKPNPWGLYDMYGNVWEVCQDWYDTKYYAQSPSDNPQGPSSGENRVSRGCADAIVDPADCRSSARNGFPGKNFSTGFRVVASAPLP
jgi:sulfatase modifying factor 1